MHGGLNKDQVFAERAIELSKSLAEYLDPLQVKDENGKPVLHDDTPRELAAGMARFLANQIYAKGLRPFLEIYVPLYIAGEDNTKIIEGADEAASKEQHFQVVAYVARHPERFFTLFDLTATVYNPKRAGHHYYRRQVRETLMPPLATVGLWACEPLPRKAWKVKAGPAQILFNKYIACPWAEHQAIVLGEYMQKMQTKWNGEKK
jgi:hypothetical protein